MPKIIPPRRPFPRGSALSHFGKKIVVSALILGYVGYSGLTIAVELLYQRRVGIFQESVQRTDSERRRATKTVYRIMVTRAEMTRDERVASDWRVLNKKKDGPAWSPRTADNPEEKRFLRKWDSGNYPMFIALCDYRNPDVLQLLVTWSRRSGGWIMVICR